MNWDVKKLSDIATTSEDGNWIESKDQSPNGIRLVQTGNVGDGRFKDRRDKARYISEETFKKLRCTEIHPGDILVSRLPDPVGRACVLPETGEKMITAVDCTIIRLNENECLPKWLLYYTISDTYQFEIQKRVTGATRQRISRKNLGLIPIPVAPLPEQQRIVSILDQAFAAIDKAKANAEQNHLNSKELFESHLQGVFGSTGSPTKRDGWEKVTLGEVCEFSNGKAHEKNIDENGGYILVNSKFISSDGAIFKRTNVQLTPLFKGDIAFVMSDVPNGKALAKCFLVDQDDTYSLNQRICVIRSNEYDKKFLYYHLNRHEYLLSFNNGENQTNLRKNDILNCPLFRVPMVEQQAIVRQLNALRAETQKLEAVYQKKMDDLEELKKSILQKAFGGELETETLETA